MNIQDLRSRVATARNSLSILVAISFVIVPLWCDAAVRETVLHSFSGCELYFCEAGDRDGLNPTSQLIPDAAGNLYGTTEFGGEFGSGGDCYPFTCGTVFKLTPTSTGWKKTTIYYFKGVNPAGVADGSYTTAGLLLLNGALYGTTYQGGSGSSCIGHCGTVYRLTPPSNGHSLWNETMLYSFQGLLDGSGPSASLIADQSGALYGTFHNQNGGVFKLTPPSPGQTAWTESVISTGLREVVGPLVADANGNLYGNSGTPDYVNVASSVFELTPQNMAKTSWATTILHNFTTTGVEGYDPAGGIVIDNEGNLYTTTTVGAGSGCVYQLGCGTVFELSPSASGNWTVNVLHTFTGGADGGNSEAGLAIESAGNLYGTTSSAGFFGNYPSGSGVVFTITAAKQFEVLYRFKGWCCSSIYGQKSHDGQGPYAAPLVWQGSLFGTTTTGGKDDLGAVYEVSAH
jgi:hypothetical protein